ncbi:hypothetical protein [Aestuariimicrobium sp. Y1814]|uniref:hypothetical protein n=1 Tax=Aestuariimicrobium sp. Y1814 TaxID=3418742 RepID=UPI003DA741C0
MTTSPKTADRRVIRITDTITGLQAAFTNPTAGEISEHLGRWFDQAHPDVVEAVDALAVAVVTRVDTSELEAFLAVDVQLVEDLEVDQ